MNQASTLREMVKRAVTSRRHSVGGMASPSPSASSQGTGSPNAAAILQSSGLSSSAVPSAAQVADGGVKKAPRKVISITSGKGGVGKTSVVVNLALSLARIGKRVLILDADLGLANIDVLLGIKPKYHLGHVFLGHKPLSEVIIQGPQGVMILPASSGMEELASISEEQRLNLLSQMDLLEDQLDIMLIDTAPGISSNVIYFNLVAEEIVVLTSPEPTSIIDAYALMKVLSSKYSEKRFHLLVNMASSPEEAEQVFRNLTVVAEKFLEVSIDYLGYILMDEKVGQAVRMQKPVTEAYADCPASRCFSQLARNVSLLPEHPQPKGGIQFFWHRLWEERVRLENR